MNREYAIVRNGLAVLVFATSGSMSAVVAQSASASLKFGFISQNTVSQTLEGKELEKKILAEQQELSKQIESKQKAYTAALNELNAQASVLKPEEREAKAEKIAQLKDDVERFGQSAERKMQRLMQEASQEALKSFSVAAKEYAEKYSYDLLLSEAGIVYVKDGVDNTEEMRFIMNKNYEVKLAQNKKTEVKQPAAQVASSAVKKPVQQAAQKALKA